MNTPQVKTCTKCGETKQLEAYGSHRGRKDGLSSRCKVCTNSDAKRFREVNAERISERRRGRRQEWRKARYAAIKDHELSYYKNYRAANLEKQRERSRKWYHENKERAQRTHREWAQANPEKPRAREHRRRARLLNAEGSYTVEQWVALRAWFGDVCLACGSKEDITIDHVVPLCKGGTNSIENLQPLCKSCNSRKRTLIKDYRNVKQLAAFLKAFRNRKPCWHRAAARLVKRYMEN